MEKSTEFPQLQKFFLLPLECARVFYEAGARLVLCGRNKEALEELVEELVASQAAQVSQGCSLGKDPSSEVKGESGLLMGCRNAEHSYGHTVGNV